MKCKQCDEWYDSAVGVSEERDICPSCFGVPSLYEAMAALEVAIRCSCQGGRVILYDMGTHIDRTCQACAPLLEMIKKYHAY